MRILLFTGKGGVGKSTVSAGTAAMSAARGRRTLVLSTDAAHSLADAFDLASAREGGALGSDPVEVAEDLYVQHVDAQRRFEQSWAEVQGYLLSVLDTIGVDRIAAEELTILPGAEEVFALLELRRMANSGEWDTIVVDCAPTAETLRLLALPEALGWYLDRILPVQRKMVKALKPVLTKAAGVPMPGDSVFDALVRLHGELTEVRALLSGPQSSVRIVLTPERVVLAEARRSWTTLSLYGYRVDGVLANRIFPAGGSDDWRAGWVKAQDDVLGDVGASFEGLPVWRSYYRPTEPVGVTDLRETAEAAYASVDGVDPLAVPETPAPFRTEPGTDPGTTVVHLALPGLARWVERDQVQLGRNGDELAITVGAYRRLLTLPAALARMSVTGARVEDGELRVTFSRPSTDTESE
ncbi:arsenite-transporting ATPase [Nocardioides luteus]|uniref:Arsenic-transporting ATPase n=1 Tax=Nocardioides luteus TaxID=1844 RepID=A0ABQ5SUH8_9ACTN|nr:ArsA family ATPase [Nocardioides luteus]MDR7309949.1 arsenite-transporting ATPase [Nocardioides luteus]GGR59406.1 arsenic-transporting ATPase [Nocardioides luteus]GLJ67142.1 arsenic-transporting ATPase [Nocardioides luteus]